MQIEILEGRNEVKAIQKRDGSGSYYVQVAYIDLGKAYPEEFQFGVASPAHGYPVGRYRLAPQSFKVNQYGRLEINGYDFKLIPLAQDARKAS